MGQRRSVGPPDRGAVLGVWLAAAMFLAVPPTQTGAALAEARLGPHSLATGGTGTGEDVCVFCHTPGTAAGTRPGWSPEGAAVSFATYDMERADGGVHVREGVSIACLSCHDGSQAPDVGASMAAHGPGAPAAGGGGSVSHPVGVPFADFSGTVRRDPGSVARLQRAVIDERTRWWIDTEAVPDGIRDKTDIILYTRAESGQETPYLECATCHDPHANPERMFLRMPNAGSGLCMSCHSY